MDAKKFIKVKNELSLIKKYIKPGAKVIDVGCGEGNLVKFMLELNYDAFGIDNKPLIEKAVNKPDGMKLKSRLLPGKAEKIPFGNGLFDYAVMFASFHHIAKDKMKTAFSECKRVLKPFGKLIIVEPYPLKGHYYELLKLAQDEKEIQGKAYNFIRKYSDQFFRKNAEKYFYVERNAEDYKILLNAYIRGKIKRMNIFKEAEKIIYKGKYPALFKSTVRVNVLSG